MSALDRALTIDDLKKLAKRRVPKQFFDYIDSGAYTEGTYKCQRGRLQEDHVPAAGGGQPREPQPAARRCSASR